MKNISFYITGALFFSLLALSTTASAAKLDIANANPGDDVTISSATAGAADIVFSPSTNVNIKGESDFTSFAIWGWHQNVVEKASGQAYGMAGDDNKLAFVDISANTTILDATSGTNAVAAFADWTTI